MVYIYNTDYAKCFKWAEFFSTHVPKILREKKNNLR